MEQAIQILLSEHSQPEDIEAALEQVQTECLANAALTTGAAEVLADFMEKRKEKCNAKLRRKVSRLIERIKPQSNMCKPFVGDTSPEAITDDDFATALQKATSREEIENLIPHISLLNFTTYPVPQLLAIKKALESISDNSEITLNAKVRRRIKRLIEDMSQIIPEKSPGTLYSPNNAVSNPGVVQKLPICEVIRLLQAASCIADVTGALNSMDISNLRGDVDCGAETHVTVSALRDELDRKLQTGAELTNKKIRHRMKKAVFILDTLLTGERPAKIPTTSTIVVAPVASVPALLQTLLSAENEGDIVSALTAVPARAEELLSYFKRDRDAILSVKDAIQQACARCVGLIGAKGKRKLSRITTAMESLVGVRSTEKKRPRPEPEPDKSICPDETAELHTKKKGKSTAEADDAEINKKANEFISNVLAKLRSSTSSGEVEAALSGVGGESGVAGNFSNRRALKRLLTKLLATSHEHDTCEGFALTSNARRRVKRVLDSLEVASALRSEKYGWKLSGSVTHDCPDSEDNMHEEPSVSNNVRQIDTKRTIKEKKPSKMRLFIGQLAFSTTESDIRNHIAQHGINCEVQIRMLTEKDSGEFRGSAFVDVVGGKRSLKRFMGMHHTMLNGRRINVERTSRASKTSQVDEARALGIQQERLKQKIAHSEAVDKMLTKYADTGITDKVNGLTSNDFLMNRLYAMNMKELRGILDEYRNQVEPGASEQNEATFRKILHGYDDGGSAVDQARRDTSRNRSHRELSATSIEKKGLGYNN